MAKYIPGKVWMMMGKIYLSKREGVPGSEAFASIVLEIVLEICASLFFFFFFFLFTFLEQPLLSGKVVFALLALMVGGLLFLHPLVFYWVINSLLSWVKQEKIQVIMHYRDMVQLFLLFAFAVLCQGIAFYIFVNAICPLPIRYLLGLTGSLAVAGVLGTLSFFAPSGLGVREGVLALLLSAYVIAPMAVLLSLLARLWVTLGEAVCALVAWRL